MIRLRTMLALAAACLLAACGGDDTGSSGGGGGTGSPPPVNTVPIAGAPTLVLTIGGTAQGVDYDTLAVDGRATLGGNLQARFTNGFRPASGQSFVLVTATGGITGTFAAVNTEGTPVTIRYETNRVTVTVI